MSQTTKARKTHKLKKYEDIKSNCIVIPVAIKTFGPWVPKGIKLIKEVGKKICDLTAVKKDQRPTYFSLFQLQFNAVMRQV